MQQIDVEKETKIPKKTIEDYETGKSEPNLENFKTLIEFYQIDADWLVGVKIDTNKRHKV